MRGTDTLTHRSPYNGMMLFSTDIQHTAPTDAHDPLRLAIAPNKSAGIGRAMSVKVRPNNGEVRRYVKRASRTVLAYRFGLWIFTPAGQSSSNEGSCWSISGSSTP